MNPVAEEYIPVPETESSGTPEPVTTEETTPLRPGEFDPLAEENASATRPKIAA